MDRSRSPRVPLSDEAHLLQRLAEPELPSGVTDAERAAARAEAAAGVEAAVDELGGQRAHAYQELRPDWQPAPTDIEISNQRAVELTAARAEVTRLSAGITAMRDELYDGIDYSREAEERAGPEFAGVGGEVARRHMRRALDSSYRNRLGETTTPQPFTGQGKRLGGTTTPLPRPFTGQGNRLGE